MNENTIDIVPPVVFVSEILYPSPSLRYETKKTFGMSASFVGKACTSPNTQYNSSLQKPHSHKNPNGVSADVVRQSPEEPSSFNII